MMYIEADKLLNILKQLQMILPQVNLNPILSCFKFSKGRIECSNGTIYGCAKVSAVDFKCLVDAKTLIEIISVLGKKKIDISLSKKTMKIKSVKFLATLSLFPIDKAKDINFVKVEKKHKFKFIRLPKKEIFDTAHSIIKDDISLMMNQRSIFTHKKIGVCSDGFRLFCYTFDHKANDLIIPSGVIKIIQDIGTPKSASVSGLTYKLIYPSIEFIVGANKSKPTILKRLSDIKKKIKKYDTIIFDKKLKESIERINSVGKNAEDKICTITYINGDITINATQNVASASETISVKGKKKNTWSALINIDFLAQLIGYSDGSFGFAKFDKSHGMFFFKNKKNYFFVAARIIK